MATPREREAQDDTGHDRPDRRAIRPAPHFALRDAEHYQCHARETECRTAIVDLALRVRIFGLAQDLLPEHHSEQGEGNVDEKERSPAERVDQHAADRRAERRGEATHRAPDGDGLGALLDRKLGQHQGERGGRELGPADGLHHASEHEKPSARRDTAQQRTEAEPQHAANETAFATEHVGETTRGQQCRGIRDGVGGEHPGEHAAAAEVFLDRALGDDDDRQVERHQECRNRSETENSVGVPERRGSSR